MTYPESAPAPDQSVGVAERRLSSAVEGDTVSGGGRESSATGARVGGGGSPSGSRGWTGERQCGIRRWRGGGGGGRTCPKS
jgi:hypothetical protein